MLEIRDLRHEYAGRTVLSVPQWSVAKGESSLVIDGRNAMRYFLGSARISESSIRSSANNVSSFRFFFRVNPALKNTRIPCFVFGAGTFTSLCSRCRMNAA